MASIPLAALSIRPPEQQADPVTKFLQMRSMMGQQQLQQQQITAGNQENQMRAMQLQDSQTLQSLAPKYIQKDPDTGKVTGYDYDGLMQGAVSAGVRPQSLAPIQTMQKNAADTLLAQQQGKAKALENQNTLNDQFTGHLEAFRNAPPEQRQQILDSSRAFAAQNNMQWTLPTDASQITPQHLDIAETGLAMHSQAVKEAQTKQDTAKAAVETALNQNKVDVINAWKADPMKVLAQVDQIAPPTGPNAALNSRTKSQVWFALQRGDVDGAKAAIQKAAEQVGAVEKDVQSARATMPIKIQQAAGEAAATMPIKVQLAARTKLAEQTITQGDPAAAGKLLADGSLTLSELKSRGTTPDFIVRATNAAGPGFNPQKAEAELAVAKSPANVAFFGSARSLTDKGGTLDQLADAAKDIPGGKIPVFNSIADALKASTGSGPIAKYASILLGVGDDYSKVMGGGQGSDTSRTQALKLAPTNASPAARAAAIEGIRGSVSSQINSRIGNNTVLKNMYGGGATSGTSTPAQPTAQPTAQTHSFSVSAWKRANPTGDLNAASAAAKAQGFQVVP